MFVWKWLLVFGSTVLADVAWTCYFIETEKRAAVKGAMWSTLIVAFGAVSTVEYVHNRWLITAALSGAFAGTWATIKFAKAKK